MTGAVRFSVGGMGSVPFVVLEAPQDAARWVSVRSQGRVLAVEISREVASPSVIVLREG